MNAPIMEEWADLVDREGVPEDLTGPVAMVRATTRHEIAEEDGLTVLTDEADPGDENDASDDETRMEPRLAIIAQRAGMIRVHK